MATGVTLIPRNGRQLSGIFTGWKRMSQDSRGNEDAFYCRVAAAATPAATGVGSGGYAGDLTPQLFMWRGY